MTQEAITTGKNGDVIADKERRILVDVQNLKKYFPVRSGLLQRVTAWVKAVDDVSFHIYEGETFGLVGESGCGKTTVGRTILHLIPPTAGKVCIDGQDIFNLSGAELKSNVSLSGPTKEPFCVASGLTTSCKAQCRMCVTV